MDFTKAINTTPHDIHLYKKDGDELKLIMSIQKSEKHQVRLTSANVAPTVIGGVPVVKAPEFVGIDNMPTDESVPIFVSLPTGEYIRNNKLRKNVFGPDTGPAGVVRDDKGGIKGCTQFVEFA